MKRDVQSDDSGPDNKRNRRNDDIVRLLIPSRIAGAIIGKGGQHIQKMRSQYKATVSVDDCQGPERTILISSDMESACSIISEMLKYFEEKDDEVDVRMLIHQSLAGCVIGKAGAKIKEIRDKIGCRILKVFSNVAPQSTDRIVQIIGKQEQCVNAVREVLNLTRDTPLKGAVHNYDPINFDDVYADEYGGYGGVQNGGGGGGGGGGGAAGGNFRGGDRQSRFDRGRDTNRFGSGDRGGGRRDDRSRSGGRRDREYINPWANESNSGGGAGPGSMGGGAGFGSGGGAGFGGGAGGGFGGGNGGGFNSGGGGGGGGFGGFGSSGGATGGFSGGAGGGGGGAGGFGAGNFGGGGTGGFGGGGQGGNFGSGGGFGGGGNLGGNMGNGMGGGLGGGSMGGGGNMGGSGGGFGGGGMNGQNDGKNSTQVTIPKDLAGAIIGKAGGRIKRIRQESGAYITIDEPLPGSNDRIITISGNQKQIQMAQYLLQQSVHENRRKF